MNGVKALKGNISKTAEQLVKEFSIPFLISFSWTAYVLWGEKLTVQSIGANFGGAFFFVSWMTGQFFRVQKQAGVTDSLSNVENRINAVIDNLEEHTRKLVGCVTGGNSYVYLKVVGRGSDFTTWIAAHGGECDFPVYGATAEIVDLDLFDALVVHGDVEEAYTSVSIGDLIPRGARIVKEFDLGEGDARNFNIFITARNGHIDQKLRFRRVNGSWTRASRVNNDSGVVLVEVDKDYPKNDLGEVCWD